MIKTFASKTEEKSKYNDTLHELYKVQSIIKTHIEETPNTSDDYNILWSSNIQISEEIITLKNKIKEIDDYDEINEIDIENNRIKNIYDTLNIFINANKNKIDTSIGIINDILQGYAVNKSGIINYDFKGASLNDIDTKINNIITNTNENELMKTIINDKYNITYISQIYLNIRDIDLKYKILKYLLFTRLDNMIEFNDIMTKELVESIFSYELISLYIEKCSNNNVDFILNILEQYSKKFTINEYNNMLLIKNINNDVTQKINIKVNKLICLFDL